MNLIKKYTPALGVAILVLLWLVTARTMARFDILLLDRLLPGLGWLQIAGACVLGFWLMGKFLDPRQAPRWRRRIWLWLSAVFFGQLLLGLTVSPVFLMTGKLHFPVPMMIEGGVVYRGALSFMPVLFLSTVLLTGPAWCSHLCYMGGCDLNRARAGKGFTGGFSGPVRGRWWFRGGAVAVVAAIAWLLRTLGAPGWLLVALPAVWGLAGWGIVLLLSPRRRQMVHCNLYCPIGAIVSVSKWINPVRLRFTSSCTGCMRCARTCAYAAITRRDLDRGRPAANCTLCGDCYGACRHGAVEYRLPGLRGSRARTVYLVIVLSVYVAFLMLARI